MTNNLVGAHAISIQGTGQQYTVPSQQYADRDPIEAFPDAESGATFLGVYRRCQHLHRGDIPMHDNSGRENVMFVFVLPFGEPNNAENRREIGRCVAANLTRHAASSTALPADMFSYQYPKTFQYGGDDPRFGTDPSPIAAHFMTRDAIMVYLNQFVTEIPLDQLAQEDNALIEIFGTVTDEIRALTSRGGAPERVSPVLDPEND